MHEPVITPPQDRAEYANACIYEADRAERESRRHPAGSPEAMHLMIDASELYDKAAQARESIAPR